MVALNAGKDLLMLKENVLRIYHKVIMFVSYKTVLIVSAIIIVENVHQGIQFINLLGVNVSPFIAQLLTAYKLILEVILVKLVNKVMFQIIYNAKKLIKKFHV